MKLQRRAARTGFDWPDVSGPRAKIDEELAELDAENDLGPQEEELGDLLFTIVNLARHLKIDPEAALRGTLDRFGERVASVEQLLRERDLSPMALSAQQLDGLWKEAKETVKRARS